MDEPIDAECAECRGECPCCEEEETMYPDDVALYIQFMDGELEMGKEVDCECAYGGWCCTKDKGHEGMHVAHGDKGHVYAVWK